MIPAFVLAILYTLAAILVLAAGRADYPWIWPTRVFLAVALVGWAGFYAFGVNSWSNFDELRFLTRWLHLPLVVALSLLSAARLYATRAERGRMGDD